MGSKNKNSKKNKTSSKDEAGATEGAQDIGDRRGRGKTVITDSRFASVHSDPRFAKLPKYKAKVAIDSRFDRMFTDKSFSSSAAQIDKRGKPKKDSSQNALKHYYRLEEEEEEVEERREKPKGKEEVEDEDIESDEEGNASEDELKKPGGDLLDLDRKSYSDSSELDEGDVDEDEESNDESSTDTTDSEEEDDPFSAEQDTFVQEENVPEIDKETHRLAVVNLDWGRVKAVDLYVLLSSFLPKGGQMMSVAVYPSEFGLKRMEEEALHGPVGLFDDDNKDKGSDDDDDEIDNEKLRAYELSRLRYYYAVVECDSIATADYLYKTCDGVEFERSSNKLDLRFIPDSMEFKHPPRDVAKEGPASYEGLDFQTRALQLSKINLTWDEDEPQRTKSLKRKFNAEQLAELEVQKFLASDESETDEGESDNASADRSENKHKKKDMYRALLQSGEGSDQGDEEDGQDMEVTFNTGLEDLSKRILEKKDVESETVWEQHLRKRREKKKARKNRSKKLSEDESDDYDDEPIEEMDDFFIEEPSVKGEKEGKAKRDQKGKKNHEIDKEAEAKSIAELELLLADEKGADVSVKGYNLKRKKNKGKKGKEIPEGGKIPTIDYNDPRFSSLFTSHLFALDPTDPQFKRSAAYARQLAQKQREGEREEPGTKEQAKFGRPAQLSSEVERTENEDSRPVESSLKKDKHELSSLVKSIKMKSKQVQLPSIAKISVKTGNLRTKHRK